MARNDEHGVDADVVAWTGVTWRELLGGNGDAAQPMTVERDGRGVGGCALLNLDEGDQLATAHDQVHLATAHLHSPGKDPPTVQT